jgi:hypothetical protein
MTFEDLLRHDAKPIILRINNGTAAQPMTHRTKGLDAHLARRGYQAKLTLEDSEGSIAGAWIEVFEISWRVDDLHPFART